MLAVICGVDSFVAIALFGQLNEEWLRTFLALPNGIPSHDTLGRVFARLDAARFKECFWDWVQAAFALTGGQVVPVDSQCVRGSHDRGRGLEPLHLVSAWAEANRLVPVRTAVDSRSNEITAIPELLRMAPGVALHAQTRQPASIAEIKFAALAAQCLDRRIASEAVLRAEIEAWVRDRNTLGTPVHWQFTTEDARIKLPHLYPTFE